MSEEEKMLWMFTEVNGELTGSCYTEIGYDDQDNPAFVHCVKDGNVCWSKSKVDLVFDYLTRHIEA